LTEYGVNAGTLTEERVSAILQDVYKKMDQQILRLEGTGGSQTKEVVPERVETGDGYKLHMYGGMFHRVPVDWRFPRCGVHDLWRHWWLGDTVRQIPPLKYLKIEDIKHIDSVPLTVIEKVRKVGPNLDNRRRVAKVLTDMRFLCKYVTKLVKENGNLETVITISAVDRMFASVARRILGRERDCQKQWISVVREIRKNRNEEIESNEDE
jgi:hypothetical protein